MNLTKGGITIEVTHPSDIARYKKLGYVEEKSATQLPKEQPQAEQAAKSAEDKNAEAIQAVNTSPATPSAEPKSHKGKGKPKEGEA